MDLDLSQSAIAALKTEAKAYKQEQTWNGTPTSQAQALEHVAHKYGARDWNTLSAQAKKPVRLTPGMRVCGHYLNQPFNGMVRGVHLMDNGAKLQVTVQFDTPVDVVTFDSFSAFRSRVTVVIDKSGRSPKHTSNGVPHMMLEQVLH